MSQRSVHVEIGGRVQGVGYRAWLADAAESLELAGWVRNRPDGIVEAVVSGPASAVDALLQRARNGPAAARVESVDVRETDEPEAGFHVLPNPD